MKIIITTIAILLINLSCHKSEERNNDSISKTRDLNRMDLGMAIWRKQIKKFNGNERKADSAYNSIKIIVIDDIYKKVNKKILEEDCGHIFFNRHCVNCKQTRLIRYGF